MFNALARGRPSSAAGLLVALSYVAVAVVFSWPLSRDLSGQLPGTPSGDTGVYVWNLWVFRDALIRGEWPFATSSILALAPSANLSLENYTVFQNLLALPMLALVNATVAFNLIYLAMSALTAYGTYRLALTLTTHRTIAWLAGFAFAWSPVLVARSTAHMSLVAAAPLPFVLLALRRALTSPSPTRWVAVGSCVAWAAYCDLYYAIFAVALIALVGTLWLFNVNVPRREVTPRWRIVQKVLLAGSACLVTLGAWIVASGGRTFWVGTTPLYLITLYTPALVGSVLLSTYWLIGRTLRVQRTSAAWLPVATGACWATGAATVLLAPWLLGVARYVMAEGNINPPTLWRSSPAGVDLLAFITPNPNSPFIGVGGEWLASRPGGFVENVASLPWTMIVTVVCAWRLWRRDVVARQWLAITAIFAGLALGPFVHVFGFNTGIVTPWTLLRFSPILGLARTPARFSVVVALGATMLFVVALSRARAQLGRERGNAVVALCALGLVIELAPMPRTVYAANPPSVYDVVASDPRDVRVMELPFGVRDGTFSMGNYSAASQYYQTRHRKRLTGGYLSRIPRATREFYSSGPFISTLIELSAGGAPNIAPRDTLVSSGRERMRDLRIGYVVVNRTGTPQPLFDLVSDAFDLALTAQDGDVALYTTSMGRGEQVITVTPTTRAPILPVARAR
jgi:hypothetical protein